MPHNGRRPVHTAAMRRAFSLHRPAIAAALGGLIALSPLHPAHAAAGNGTVEDEAVAACEESARRMLGAQAARPAEGTFKATTAVQRGLSNDSQIVLNGEGRWRSAEGVRDVKFSCNVDRHTLETAGLVIRDKVAFVAKAAPARKPAEPDLSHLSMASCESSAVQALKKRWPRVSKIAFDTDTRSFRQDSVDRAELRGRGRALPEQGAPATLFGFECEIDPHDGQVLKTRISG